MEKYCELSEYDSIVEKLIYKHAPSYKKSPDMHAAVLDAVLRADQEYDNYGSIYGYRSFMAKFAILEFISSKRKKRFSLDEIVELEPASYKESTLFSEAEEILGKDYKYIKLYYIDNYTLYEIAKKEKVSTTAIKYKLDKLIIRLREHYAL